MDLKSMMGIKSRKKKKKKSKKKDKRKGILKYLKLNPAHPIGALRKKQKAALDQT